LSQLDRHGVEKVVPEKQVLQQHARHLLETKYTAELIAKHAKDITRRAKATALPTALAIRSWRCWRMSLSCLGIRR